MKLKISIKIIIAIMLSIAIITGNITAMEAENNEISKNVYIPLWMKPNTVIVYDNNLNYKIIQGGELSDADLIGRDDIASIGLTTTDLEYLAEPNIKVEYDLHGFYQNTYYPAPGEAKNNVYQLSPTNKNRSGTGVLADGATTGNYGQYMNYDTYKNQYNCLSRSGSLIDGTGRITYYFGTDGDYDTSPGKPYKLKKYDCATKMMVADVSSGTVVLAINTYNAKLGTYYKQDIGTLSIAILDIWCGKNSSDTANQAINNLTSSGGLDNIYSGQVMFYC